jgi:hypothetical protein
LSYYDFLHTGQPSAGDGALHVGQYATFGRPPYLLQCSQNAPAFIVIPHPGHVASPLIMKALHVLQYVPTGMSVSHLSQWTVPVSPEATIWQCVQNSPEAISIPQPGQAAIFTSPAFSPHPGSARTAQHENAQIHNTSLRFMAELL